MRRQVGSACGLDSRRTYDNNCGATDCVSCLRTTQCQLLAAFLVLAALPPMSLCNTMLTSQNGWLTVLKMAIAGP